MNIVTYGDVITTYKDSLFTYDGHFRARVELGSALTKRVELESVLTKRVELESALTKRIESESAIF